MHAQSNLRALTEQAAISESGSGSFAGCGQPAHLWPRLCMSVHAFASLRLFVVWFVSLFVSLFVCLVGPGAFLNLAGSYCAPVRSWP